MGCYREYWNEAAGVPDKQGGGIISEARLDAIRQRVSLVELPQPQVEKLVHAALDYEVSRALGETIGLPTEQVILLHKFDPAPAAKQNYFTELARRAEGADGAKVDAYFKTLRQNPGSDAPSL